MRWLRWLGLGVLALVALLVVTLVGVDTPVGHRFVASRIGEIRLANGLRFRIGRIDGSLYSDTRLVDVRVDDLDGQFLSASLVALDWSPLKWFANRLDVDRLAIPEAVLSRKPRTRPAKQRGAILPGFDIRIGQLSLGRLTLAAPVLGTKRAARAEGRADIRSGRALVVLSALVERSDRLRLRIDAEPDRDKFDINVMARGQAGGVLSQMAGNRGAVALDVGGEGRWTRWQGRADGRIGKEKVVDLALIARSGRYALSGRIAPSTLLKGKLQRLTAPSMSVRGTATFVERRLDGRILLRSPNIEARAQGMVDLGASSYRRLTISARLLRPAALFPNMTGRNIDLRVVLDGPFDTARFDYRLRAERMAFNKTGFEMVQAVGAGRLSPAPVTLPIKLTAERVTGVGNVAGGILRRLRVEGPLQVTPALLTGTNLMLRSDKLTGRISVVLDLKNGRFDVGLNGALGRYLIPGLGIVDVNSTLRVVPGPGGRGTRVVGRGIAQMRRLDNAFFRSLTGGLPRIETALERTSDGVLHFGGLVLTSPQLRLSGNGYRRRDGTFHFEGAGRQARYGPVTLVLDGRIDKPTLDLVLARPNDALGLAAVRAHLDPTPEGFAFIAQGGSRLGPFRTQGAILLPRGGQASIRVDALDVANTHARGALAITDGGFTGKLDIAGGGLSGVMLFRPVGSLQRVEAHLNARAWGFEGTTLRQGHLDLVTLLDPAGTSIEANVTAQGIRRGALSLARFTAAATLRGGIGQVRASIAGSRGRSFAVQTLVQVSPDRYATTLNGIIDRRPIRLLAPAVVVRDEAGGWRLQPTRLSFAGGEAQVQGRFGGADSAATIRLSGMPLSVLDIGYPGLGLSGSASGKIDYATGGSGPTGTIDMTIRGLSRSGLILSSQPIDVGLAGVLSADKLGLRAVMASGGKTIGRGQALLRPLGTGDLTSRIANAPLIAQLRYGGPADTLWRLTGVELFDLSGPVAIGADVTGRLAAPVIRGTVQAKGARIESAATGTVLTNVQATGRFEGSQLAIDRLTADAGKGGRVTGQGRFDFAAPRGIGLDLSVQADHAVLIDREAIGATVTGPLTFRSNGSGGQIGGDVVLNSSRYRLGLASNAAAVPKLNIREINLPGGGDEDDAPASPWTLAVKARAPDSLSVSGLGLRSEWSTDLAIAGSPQNPAITGRARLIRGDVEFAGRKFDLNRGIIRFGGEVPANPALDIEANANTTGLSATIRVTGNALKPEISFASIPALPQDELLSRLLFGTSITNLSAPEALQLASAVAALKNGGGGLDPINAIRRSAGLDRLRILPADPQTGQGSSIAAGKYVTRRLYAEIVTDGQGYSATRVEFQVTRWLSILSSISTLGRQSVNVRVSKDY